MNFAATLEKLEQAGFGFRPKGFFNVEGGDAAIATEYFDWCDCQSLLVGPAVKACDQCRRGSDNFIKLPAGDGDGVYVVFEVFKLTSPRYAVGAFSVFDFGYSIANKVRSFVENQQPLVFPAAEVLLFGDSVPLRLENLTATSTIYFADGTSGGANSSDANVDIQFGQELRLGVFGFMEPLPNDPQVIAQNFSESWNQDIDAVISKMRESQVMAETIASEFGRDLTDPMPPYTVRCLLALDLEVIAEIGLTAEVAIDDWEMYSIQLNSRIVSSHQSRQAISSIWMNAMLAREWDRHAGEVPYDEAKRLLFDIWTWAYQGIVAGDEDCFDLIANPYKATEEEIAELLSRRGLFDIAAQYLMTGKLPGGAQQTESPEPISDSGGLTKSSSAGLGLGVSQSKFCSNCGTQFADSAKFCTDCGNARA